MDYNSLLSKNPQTCQKSNYFICLFYWIVGKLISTAQLGVFGCSSN